MRGLSGWFALSPQPESHGVSATMEGQKVLFGNARLMAKHKIDLGNLPKRAEELAAQAQTPMFLAVGDTVVWTNRMNMNHTVTADNGEFDSGVLGQNQSFSKVFNSVGTFTYQCQIHPDMTGKVSVSS